MKSKKFVIKEFFQKIGYKNIRENTKEVLRGDEYIRTDEYIREINTGRYHLYIAKGQKSSGLIHYPTIKILGHFDIDKPKNGKPRHIWDKNERRITNEMYRIDKELKKVKIGSMEYKDKYCAHMSLEINDFNKVLRIIIGNGYEKYDNGKYKRRVNSHQYALQLIRKGRFIDFVCVCAYIGDHTHTLVKIMAEEELSKLMQKFKIYKRCILINNQRYQVKIV